MTTTKLEFEKPEKKQNSDLKSTKVCGYNKRYIKN